MATPVTAMKTMVWMKEMMAICMKMTRKLTMTTTVMKHGSGGARPW